MKKYFWIVLAAVLLLPVSARAQFSGGLNELDKAVGPSSKAGLQGQLTPAVTTVVTAALSLVGTIFLLLMIYGGVRWMLARGDEGEIEKGKEIIKAAIIGLVIIMAAYAITAFVGGKLSSTETETSASVSKDGGSNPQGLASCESIGGMCKTWSVGDNGLPDEKGFCADANKICVK